MSKKSRAFNQDFNDDFSDLNISDAELDAMINAADGFGGGDVSFAPEKDLTAMAPGSALEGVVIDVRGEDILVELDSKNHGVLEVSEFDDAAMPRIGDTIKTHLVRYDRARDLAVLSVKEALKEVLWDDLRSGLLLEGMVTGKNKGGLTLLVKGVRAFMPMSQIELGYVEDPSSYVGRKLQCEVTSFDRSAEEIVVSRKGLLKREAEKRRQQSMEQLQEGEVVLGKVVKITAFGAFIDVGGAEGLLHKSKITEYNRVAGKDRHLAVGDRLEVAISRVDLDRGRIGLDFRQQSSQADQVSLSEYAEGDAVMCWVNDLQPDGSASVTINDTTPGIILACDIQAFGEKIRQGAVLRGEVSFIDKAAGRIEVKPIGGGQSKGATLGDAMD